MRLIVGVLGSGREGNAHRLLVEAVGAAERATRFEGRVHRLGDLDFRGCVGCLACRQGAESCVLEDDVSALLRATASARVLALATPIYYGYATGLFKSYLDRWYAFRDADGNLRIPEGRPALLILTQGHPDPEAYRWTRDSVEKVLRAYGFAPRTLIAAQVAGPEDAAARPDLLTQAREAGAALAQT